MLIKIFTKLFCCILAIVFSINIGNAEPPNKNLQLAKTDSSGIRGPLNPEMNIYCMEVRINGEKITEDEQPFPVVDQSSIDALYPGYDDVAGCIRVGGDDSNLERLSGWAAQSCPADHPYIRGVRTQYKILTSGDKVRIEVQCCKIKYKEVTISVKYGWTTLANCKNKDFLFD